MVPAFDVFEKKHPVRRFLARNPVARAALSPLNEMRKMTPLYQATLDNRTLVHLRKMACGPIRLSVEELGYPFWIDANSDVLRRLLLDGFYEPFMVETIKKYLDPNSDFIDVGANVGFFSVFACGLIKERKGRGQVYAIEPTDGCYGLLKRNLMENNHEGAAVTIKAAVADRTGTMRLNVILGREEYSSLYGIVHPRTEGLSQTTQDVRVIRLDDLAREARIRPGLIKLDIEGGEVNALRGASAVIREYRPTIVLEVNSKLLETHGATEQELWDLFDKLNYSVLDPERGFSVVKREPALPENIVAVSA